MSNEKQEIKLSKSELELGLKIDRCLQDSLIKVGSGIGLGIVFSVVLFRRKKQKITKFEKKMFALLYQKCIIY
jgi:inner membrane organizing system protein 1